MGQTKRVEEEKAEFLRAAAAMYEELHAWRKGHQEASFDEIADEVTPRRRQLMGKLLEQLAVKADERIVAPLCAECGQEMSYRGMPERAVSHREGEVALERAYYYCDSCAGGLFPLDQRLKLSKHVWSPQTIQQAVRLAVEIPSHRRAAEAFTELTGVGISKSSLQRLCEQTGGNWSPSKVLKRKRWWQCPSRMKWSDARW